MTEELHIPWDDEGLESLIKAILPKGETTKVDLKSQFEIANSEQKAELLKDIAAFANSFDNNYNNFGFIVFGAVDGQITFTNFAKVDNLQASIDQLISESIRPFIRTHLKVFEDNDKRWGVLIIPPTRNAPHIFIKDTAKSKKGDIYIRIGTTTDKAQPEDFSRFFRQHFEDYNYPFQQKLNDLQYDLKDLQKEFNFLKASKRKLLESQPTELNNKSYIATELETKSLLENIISKFSKEEDIISKGLFNEAVKIVRFIESTEIPWQISSKEKADTEEIFSKINNECKELWLSLANLILKDDKNIYHEAIIKTISIIAKQYEVPSGMNFTDWGKFVRYYPIFITLYIVFITGVFKKKDRLLKDILSIDLKGKTSYDSLIKVPYTLFMVRRAQNLFQMLNPSYPNHTWCDAAAAYAKQLLEQILEPDTPFWHQEKEFYTGEFVLCLSLLDILDEDSNKPMVNHPSSGQFLYSMTSREIISSFLGKEKEFLQKIYNRSLKDMLKDFDNTAKSLNGYGCWMDGFYEGAYDTAFASKSN